MTLITKEMLQIDIDTICDETLDKNAKMVAVVFDKHEIISVGVSTPALSVRYKNRRLSVPAEHCEINALKQVVRELECKKIKRPKVNLLVLRRNSAGVYHSSKPCKHCTEFIKSSMVSNFIHLKKIIYYDEDIGSFVSEKLENLNTEHVSIGYRLREMNKLSQHDRSRYYR
jgi:tRNA(Arg) A34 adenosine deaminase TadA